MTLYGSVGGASVIVAMRTTEYLLRTIYMAKLLAYFTYIFYMHCIIYAVRRSHGHSWEYHGTVANSSESTQARVSPMCKAPTETSMAFLADGRTILSVWRSVGTNHPLCATTSEDYGKSFGTPRPLNGPSGVEPKLLTEQQSSVDGWDTVGACHQ